jgi:hypothetical protein
MLGDGPQYRRQTLPVADKTKNRQHFTGDYFAVQPEMPWMPLRPRFHAWGSAGSYLSEKPDR